MKVEFRSSFARDLRKVKDQDLKKKIQEIIEHVEQAQSLQEVTNVKKLRGSDRYYRIRIEDYRIGLIVERDYIIFVRFLHRKDIYKYFP